MKKFRVETRQNLTACDGFDPNGPTDRTLSVEYFGTEEEAMAAYSQIKARIKFAGLAGEYVCYPIEVEKVKRKERSDEN